MQRVRFVSDLHLEHAVFPMQSVEKELSPAKEDILLVAGDILHTVLLQEKRTDPAAQTMKSRFRKFLFSVQPFKAVYMTAGNHDPMDGGDVLSCEKLVNDFIANFGDGFAHIKMVQNARIPLTDKTDLLAATLWTDMYRRDPMVMLQMQRAMPDYHSGVHFGGQPFTPETSVNEFDETMKFFKKELLDGTKNFVIMTHHAPSFQSVPERFKGNMLNFAFCTALDDFIHNNPGISHWVHGHIHTDFDYKIGSTRVLSHIRGYPHDPSWSNFRANKYFDVP